MDFKELQSSVNVWTTTLSRGREAELVVAVIAGQKSMDWVKSTVL